jgi:hypothetical protein
MKPRASSGLEVTRSLLGSNSYPVGGLLVSDTLRDPMTRTFTGNL